MTSSPHTGTTRQSQAPISRRHPGSRRFAHVGSPETHKTARPLQPLRGGQFKPVSTLLCPQSAAQAESWTLAALRLALLLESARLAKSKNETARKVRQGLTSLRARRQPRLALPTALQSTRILRGESRPRSEPAEALCLCRCSFPVPPARRTPSKRLHPAVILQQAENREWRAVAQDHSGLTHISRGQGGGLRQQVAGASYTVFCAPCHS